MSESAKRPRIARPAVLAALGLGGAALAISAAITLSNGGAAGACPARPEAGTAIGEAARGELAALNGTGTGRGYADLAFTDGEGRALSLGSFNGRALLVNFWASWCVPCREEMPALEALAARFNGPEFTVLPINLDIGPQGLEKAKAFLAEGNWPHLPLYADTSFAAFERLKAQAVSLGLPTTLVLDKNGCELGVLQGPARWDTPDGERVIEALLALDP